MTTPKSTTVFNVHFLRADGVAWVNRAIGWREALAVARRLRANKRPFYLAVLNSNREGPTHEPR